MENLAKTIAFELLDELVDHPGFNRWWDSVDTLSKSRINNSMISTILANLEADAAQKAKAKKNSIWDEMRNSDESD